MKKARRRHQTLRGIRESRGISVTALAIEAGVSTTYVSRIERGLRVPKLDRASRIAAAYDVSLDRLYEMIQGAKAKQDRELRRKGGAVRAQ